MSDGRFLITTADERSWTLDRPVLFLGEWCRLFNRRHVWDHLDAEVAAYHWDDRQRLHADYDRLLALYETLLADTARALNEWHGVDHSVRYWRILVGPWVGFFTQIVFDRWSMVRRVADEGRVGGTIVLEVDPAAMIPNDMGAFTELFCGDLWNHFIFAQILTCCTSIQRTLVPLSDEGATPRLARPSLKGRLRDIAATGRSWLGRLAQRDRDSLLVSTYLPALAELKLDVALHQPPMIRANPGTPRATPSLERRTRLVVAAPGSSEFEACVRALIPLQMPSVYLEGYASLLDAGRRARWPAAPKAAFTSNAHVAGEVFKAWTAEASERGSRVVIGQHGGHYGTGAWSFLEDHELAIADRYVTWGWTDKNAKQRPVGALPLVGQGDERWKADGDLLLVTVSFPRYSYWMYSTPVAGQWLGYFADQFQFVRGLRDDVRRRVTVRLYRADFGWRQRERWTSEVPDVRLDDGTQPLDHLVRECRLYISTYNATTFLTTLGQNVPTIMYWNPEHWEPESAQPYFDALRAAGILHDSPAAASAQVNDVWTRVPEWWNSAQIQSARRAFCDRFARSHPQPVRALKRTLIDR